MANEILVGLTIGAALSSSFQAAFGSARSTVTRLGESADVLGRRHARLGDAMARALAHPMRNVGALRTEYERLGRTIDMLKERQDRLTASLARGESLRNMRRDLRSSAMETVGTAVAIGAPVVQATRLAMGHQDRMRDIAITGDFSPQEEAQLGNTARQAAVRWNQTQEQVAAGMGVLVAGGIQQATQLQRYAPIMAKTATATRATMDDLGAVAIALNDNLKIGADGYEASMNMLAYAGKRGQFELADMAKWLPQLSPQFAALGVTGQKAVAEIGAALQIARKGAGSNDEAANNFKNFLSKITAPDTLKSFEDAGIDLKRSMQSLVAQGMTPMQAMLGTINAYMGTKGPNAARELQSALALKDENERKAAMQRLEESYKLGELFRDMQVLSFLRPALANQAEQADIQRGAVDAAGSGVLDEDYRKRVETATEQLKALRIGLMELGISVGNALLPPLVELVNAARPVVATFSAWAQANPGIVKGVIGLVGGLLAGRVAVLAFRYAWVLGASALNFVGTGIATVSARLALLRAMVVGGRFAPLLAGLRSVGTAAMATWRALLPFGQGLSMMFLGPLRLVGQGLLFLARLVPGALMGMMRGAGLLATVLGGRLLGALRLVGQAALWLGRALLMNPIGLLVTALAVGAYLVWRHWDRVKIVLQAGWDWMRGLAARFGDAGRALIDGLVGGITSRIGAARDTIVRLATGVRDWFKSALGIQSPSRVFIGLGGEISAGAALGIARGAPGATQAAATMVSVASAQAAAMPAQTLQWAPARPALMPAQAGPQAPGAGALAATLRQADPQIQQDSRMPAAGRRPASAAGGVPAGSMVVHFSPHITVQGGDGPAVRSALDESLRVSERDMERMMRRLLDEQRRREN